MPIDVVNIDVLEGPEQRDGAYFGRVKYPFVDVSRAPHVERIGAPTLEAWTERVTGIITELNQRFRQQDANGAAEEAGEIVDSGDASRADIAVQAIRNAYTNRDVWTDAFPLFDRVNQYRISNGWNMNQLRNALVDNNDPDNRFTLDEWTILQPTISDLIDTATSNTYTAWQAEQVKWSAREEL